MSQLNDWPDSPEHPDIAPNEVHIWRARLDCTEILLQQLEESLAADELARADRYIFKTDRDSFVATRGILRQLLAKYVNHSPADLNFAYHQRGKPYLVPQPSEPRIEFNISHSQGLALLAFTLGHEVGVDVEFVRPDLAGEEIAIRYFSSREIDELRSLPASSRIEGFFLCWTRKEAYIKALGEGLQMPLTSFSVSLTPSQPEHLDSADSSRWTLRSLTPASGYLGAVVAEGRDLRLRCFDWQGNHEL
jgi:4'-phosphopantetheinyl transferase